MKKDKTNKQLIRAFIKSLDTLEVAILRERLVKIAEITEQSIKSQPEKWTNPIFPISLFQSVNKKILTFLNFSS